MLWCACTAKAIARSNKSVLRNLFAIISRWFHLILPGTQASGSGYNSQQVRSSIRHRYARSALSLLSRRSVRTLQSGSPANGNIRLRTHPRNGRPWRWTCGIAPASNSRGSVCSTDRPCRGRTSGIRSRNHRGR